MLYLAVAFDLEKECGFQEWDEATTARVNRYLAAVVAMQDPKVAVVGDTVAEPAPMRESVAPDFTADPMGAMMGTAATPEDLPF